MLDYLGAIVVGASMHKEKGERLLASSQLQNGKATLIGFKKKGGLENATLINGISSHIAELDDGTRFGMLHPGAAIISAMLPLAEIEGVAGNKFLRGIVTGYEAAIRIGASIQPSHYSLGYHPTATCGTIGAAIGISSMLDFNKDQMLDTLSAAAISASGSLKVLENSSELKPFNAGRAALIGSVSAMMARAGYAGPDDVLSGKSGFLEIMSQDFDLSKLINNASMTELGIYKVYFKPYASCRHTHAPIEAALKIKSSNNIDIKNICSITVKTYESVLGKHDHKKISGINSAKMSIPFSVAVALKYGDAGIAQFTKETILDHDVFSLTDKVTVLPDSEITALVPAKRAAEVTIIDKNGNSHSMRIDFPKGEPENPLTESENIEKFMNLAAYVNINNHCCKQVVDTVKNIENRLDKLYPLLMEF